MERRRSDFLLQADLGVGGGTVKVGRGWSVEGGWGQEAERSLEDERGQWAEWGRGREGLVPLNILC